MRSRAALVWGALGAAGRWLRRRPLLLTLVGLHALLSALISASGSPLGTYGLECSMGVIAYDLAHGLNPAVPLLDYFDTFTGGYLTQGLIAAPFALALPTTLALELGQALTNAAILVLACLLLERAVGRTAARVGTAALALGPPQLRYHSMQGPSYHYDELLFDFAMAALVVEIVLHRRRSWRWFFALGLVAGYALFNCYGSAAFIGVAGAMVWVGHRRWLEPAVWAGVPGFALGSAPLWWKAWFHAGYHGAPRPLRDFLFSHGGEDARSGLGWILQKLGAFASGDYGLALGFMDTLGAWFGTPVGVGFGLLYGWASLAALLAVPLLLRRGVVAGLRGLLPGDRFAPATPAELVALLPAANAVALILAYLSAEIAILDPDPEVSQFRVDRYLPPLTAMLALNLGVLAERLPPMLRRPVGGLGLLLGGGALLAQLGMVDWAGFAGPIPYRGRCYAVEALFAADVIDGDVERGRRFCSGFPEGGRGDCFRGVAWAVGIQPLLSDPEALDGGLPPAQTHACLALPEEWRRECFRQQGWHLVSTAVAWEDGADGRARQAAAWCAQLPGGEAVAQCQEGFGWYFADHYLFDPTKLHAVLPEDAVGPEAWGPIAAGVGAYLAHLYDHEPTALRFCERLAPVRDDLPAACREGYADGLASFARGIPGGPVEPGPITD